MLFSKKPEEPKQSQLLGEDFDIYPDLGDRPKPAEQTPAVQEPEEEEVVEPTPFQKKVAEIPEKKWNLYQIIFGIILGIGASLCITVVNKLGTMSSLGFVLALVVVLVIPNFVERQCARKMKYARLVMAIVLAVAMIGFVIYGLITDPTAFTRKK